MDRVDELNTRLASRLEPVANRTPNFDPRPASTKYALFGIVDARTKPEPNAIQATHLDRTRAEDFQRGFTPLPSVDPSIVSSNTPFGPKHELLFQTPTLITTNRFNVKSAETFYNHTRTQLRNS
jgi:hypothetical protein